MKEYLNELINTYPETQTPILANYRALLEGRDDKNDFYAKCFYTKINNFLALIAKRDTSLFETPGKVFIEGIDLYTVWNNTNSTEENRAAIWKYLQILMILGRKIIPNHKEIVELLQKVSQGNISIPSKVEKTLTTEEKDESENVPGVFGLGDIASSIGSLGNIASGLGLGNLVGGSGGEGGIGNLISSITQVFNNPEFSNAMSQLSESMAAASNTTNTNTNTNTDNADSDNTATGNECAGDDTEPSTPTPTSSNPTTTTTETPTGNTNATPSGIPPLFNNNLFGDLAKELTDTFNFEEMEKEMGGKPANIGDALGKFMTGNNPAKLMGLVGKFGAKLQQEVQKGAINPAELLQQTMGAMGPGMADMMKNMAGNNPQVQQNLRKQSARDRLRAKLEKRNASNASNNNSGNGDSN